MFLGRNLSVGPENTNETILTFTHRKHATEIAKGFSLDYDAIVTASGEGLTYEILNGFAEHENPRAAFVIPLLVYQRVRVTGCISLMGHKVTTDSSPYEKLCHWRSTLTWFHLV